MTDRQTEMVKTIPSALEKMGLVGTGLHDLQLKTKWHKVWGQWPLTQFLSPSFRHPCSDDCHFVTRPASQKSVHRQTVRHMNNWQHTGNSFCVSSCYNTPRITVCLDNTHRFTNWNQQSMLQVNIFLIQNQWHWHRVCCCVQIVETKNGVELQRGLA